jgi:hypothetical protein
VLLSDQVAGGIPPTHVTVIVFLCMCKRVFGCEPISWGVWLRRQWVEFIDVKPDKTQLPFAQTQRNEEVAGAGRVTGQGRPAGPRRGGDAQVAARGA